jgi:hypothetical protein
LWGGVVDRDRVRGVLAAVLTVIVGLVVVVAGPARADTTNQAYPYRIVGPATTLTSQMGIALGVHYGEALMYVTRYDSNSVVVFAGLPQSQAPIGKKLATPGKTFVNTKKARTVRARK